MNEDLTQILPRSNARLKCLELFDTRHPFRANNFELSDFLAGCFEELWIEDCWSWSFESSLRSYQSLRTVHVDGDVFSKVAPFLPIDVRTISIACTRLRGKQRSTLQNLRGVVAVDINGTSFLS